MSTDWDRLMIAELEGIGKSCLSRILRVTLLVPDVVHAILAGRTNQGMMLEQLGQPLPASWDEQRARILEPNVRNAVLPARWSFSNRRLLCFSGT
jgi:hypothetical protein